MNAIARFRLMAGLFMLLLGRIATPAHAALIGVVNASFESPPLLNGHFTAQPDGTTAVPGWMIDGGIAGVWNPTVSDFSVPIPDGEQIALSNGGAIQQVLGSTLTADTIYTLQVEIGRRINYGFPGYEIGLYAGGQLLANDNSSIDPVQNSFQTLTLTYEASAGNPLLGQLLEIRIRSFGDQVNFDNVRLDSDAIVSAVPEPAALVSWCALSLFGLIARITGCRVAKH
jgi:hypothetical protein